MEQYCPGCEVLIDRPARFCRQCGTRLVADVPEPPTSAIPIAVTEPNYQQANYQQPEYRPAEYQPGMYLAGISEVADTGRLYTPPAALPQPVRRRVPVLRIAAVALLLLIAVGIGAGILVYSLVSTGRPGGAFVEQLKTDTRGEVMGEIARARDELNRARAEAARVLPDAAIPAPPPETIAAMADFRYPQSTLKQSVSVLGNDVLKTTSTDKFSQIREHYQRLIGPPIVENISGGNDEVVFKSAGTPPVIVTISRENSRPDEVSIVILRSKLLEELPAGAPNTPNTRTRCGAGEVSVDSLRLPS